MTHSITKIELPNGVRFVHEPMPQARSASLGIFLEFGSRNESAAENGISHFLEHMLFKGTRTHDAAALNHAMNLLGGNINAFTTQESIALTAKVVDEDLIAAANLLADMLLESTFPADEIERERNVILEEVKMYDDTPDELVLDMFMSHLYPHHALGRPILGTPDTLAGMGRDQILGYLGRELQPQRIVIALAGRYDATAIEDTLRARFEGLQSYGTPSNGATNGVVSKDVATKKGATKNGAASRPKISAETDAAPVPAFVSHNLVRRTQQMHFCIGTTAPHRSSPDRYAFSVLNTILGGGNSSRIFQEIREKRGLAYSVGSMEWSFRDTGCFAISGGTSPRNLRKVVDLCLAEVQRIASAPVTDAELESAKKQIRTGNLLSMESTSSRMSRLADCEIIHGHFIPVDTSIARIQAVTADDIQNLGQNVLSGKPTAFASIGPSKAFEPYENGVTF